MCRTLRRIPNLSACAVPPISIGKISRKPTIVAHDGGRCAAPRCCTRCILAITGKGSACACSSYPPELHYVRNARCASAVRDDEAPDCGTILTRYYSGDHDGSVGH